MLSARMRACAFASLYCVRVFCVRACVRVRLCALACIAAHLFVFSGWREEGAAATDCALYLRKGVLVVLWRGRADARTAHCIERVHVPDRIDDLQNRNCLPFTARTHTHLGHKNTRMRQQHATVGTLLCCSGFMHASNLEIADS